jgi:hypothetical protein
MTDRDMDKAPTPVVKIDNMSDAFATIVSVEFGDRLGELLDTVSSRCASLVCLVPLRHTGSAAATPSRIEVGQPVMWMQVQVCS